MNVLRAIFAERRCLACARPFTPADGHTEFCPACAGALPRRLDAFCPICAELYAGPGPAMICPGCREQPPPWGRIHFHGSYEGKLRELILRLKFGGELHLALGLAGLLGAHPGLTEAAQDYDLIVPIPLHAKRLGERGFNQAGEIAFHLGKKLYIPAGSVLTRTLHTGHQIGLSRRDRAKNLRGAFKTNTDVAGKNILLLDDVMTTGATMASAARSLLNAGAGRVDAMVPARTRARNMLRESRNL